MKKIKKPTHRGTKLTLHPETIATLALSSVTGGDAVPNIGFPTADQRICHDPK